MKLRGWIVSITSLAFLITCGCSTLTYDSGELVPMGDNELAAEVQSRLEEDDLTGDYTFGVTAMAGSVTLRGTVGNEMIRARAIGIVLGTQGVREVHDRTLP